MLFSLHNGKTHVATSIGIAAAKKRISTYFITCHDLIQNLKRAMLENRLDARLKHDTKYKLLIINEIGYLPIEREDAKLFFQLIDMRYEKRSTMLTTNVNFRAWDEVFCEPKLANAILDRILHHATVVTIVGDSYRLKNHLAKDDDSFCTYLNKRKRTCLC
ncbi:Insertion sequence IS5376 putative ATP-binding protein [Acidibacillus sp. S0AB]|uniref:Insertion sequence IS5376 putative ATP-binding protein n=1 Tax=Sulfoacidibacillus ferrooxidans TaxID=2005001 RepID=A0A9X2AFN8_9BACL|nr:Insertion sequence IS5376 putative ATP-binding protein [Sulfoacidibacillus ferrooxidans]